MAKAEIIGPKKTGSSSRLSCAYFEGQNFFDLLEHITKTLTHGVDCDVDTPFRQLGSAVLHCHKQNDLSPSSIMRFKLTSSGTDPQVRQRVIGAQASRRRATHAS